MPRGKKREHQDVAGSDEGLQGPAHLADGRLTVIDAPKTTIPEPAPPSELQKIQDKLDQKFVNITELWFAVTRPLPTKTGDGSYLKEEHHDSLLQKVATLKASDVQTLVDLASDTVKGRAWDDREYLLERIVKTASSLKDPAMASKLTNLLLTALYNDLQHPPQSYLGSSLHFRSPDGSNNGHNIPHIGAANTPYARTVPPAAVQPSSLPDPGTIFDSIFRRTSPKPHPNKISSMLFYLATIIIHDLFRTSHEDPNISQTSSYLDLSPLYGSNKPEQQAMRTFKDGKLKPDCFSEKRIMGFPPGVSALLIMFNRFHNHVVENLAAINEGGRFTKPQAQPLKPLHSHHHWAEYDERLFQTGRLVTCGLYINIILVDYVRTILNLNRTDSDWKLDPRVDIEHGPPRGAGNQVSAEFNLIYRWHSTISYKDERWIEDTYRDMFPDRDPETIPMAELLKKLSQMEQDIDDDPVKRTFGGLKRGANHAYDDGALVDILVGGIEDCANSFGAKSVPAVLRAVEILGMKQARRWGMATLNEFRAHFNLKKYGTFEEINPEIADELRHLYDTPDHVELYPGLVCEDTKRAELPGSGLMPGYTTSRAILSDAVALVRGDRFYTIDYTPQALTNWGYAEASSNSAFDHGCVFYKLFNTAFPQHFEYNSIYAHYPLTIPEENKVIMEGLGMSDYYNFDRPTPNPKFQSISTYAAATQVMENKQAFGVAWGPAMRFLMGPPALQFMLAADGPAQEKSRKLMGSALYPPPQTGQIDWEKDVKDFYLRKTREMLFEKSYRLSSTGKRRVDIVRDVTNLVHVHFCAQIFCLPLKTEEHPHGVFSEQQLYIILAAVFICVFFDADPVHSYEIHQLARDACQKLGNIVEENVTTIKHTGFVSRLIQYFFKDREPTNLQRFGIATIEKLTQSNIGVHELVWGHILGTAGGMVPNQGQLFSEMLDFYLNDPIGQRYWPEVVVEAKSQDTPESDDRLMRYMLEGSRLSCGSAVMRKVRMDSTIHDGSRTIEVKENERVFVNLWAASRDPERFPDPLEIKLDRPIADYVQLGHGPHKCLEFGVAQVSLTAMLRVVASQVNLRPVPGDQGRIVKVPAGQGIEGYNKYVVEDASGAHFFPFPMSMKVEWDDDDDVYALERTQSIERKRTLPLVNGAAEAEDAGFNVVNGHAAMQDAADHRVGGKRGGRGSARSRGSKRVRR